MREEMQLNRARWDEATRFILGKTCTAVKTSKRVDADSTESKKRSSETFAESGCSTYNVTSAWIPYLGRAVAPKSPA